jgi:Beta-lactamase enzyme family
MAVTRSRWTRTTSCRPHRRSRSRWHSRCGCQISTGELDPGEHLPFTAERAPLRDGTIEQAVDLMLRLSDNVATNVLLHRVTRERIMTRLSSLGLTHTTISHDVFDEVADITARLDKLARAAGFTNWMEANDLVYAGQYDQIQDRLAKITVDEQVLPDAQLGRPRQPGNWPRSTGRFG